MHIERNHNLGQPEAIRRIDSFLDGLMSRPFPGGVTIQDPARSWFGNTMSFSFRAKKGWVGATIAGTLRVTDETVVLESALPGLVTAFMSEDEIAAVINRQFDTLFQA